MKVQVLNNWQFLKSDLGWRVRVLFVFRLSRRPSGPGFLTLKSDPNPGKLFLLICLPQIWSIISLCRALNFGSSSCTQFSLHEQSEKTSAIHWESQWCGESGGSSECSPSGCSLNIRLFAFCSGTVEHRGKLRSRVFLFRIPWAAEFD